MADSWATFGARPASGPARLPAPGLRAGLTDALRDAVRTGRLAPGTRLPSSRSLAADLGIARNTVADAYAELVAEGWLTARQGSGTRVAETGRRWPAGRPPRPRPRPPGGPAYDLAPRHPRPRLASRAPSGSRRPAAPSPPPRTRLSATATREAASNCAPRSPATSPGPAAYAPTPNASLICSGFAHGLMLLGAVLRQRERGALAVESYGLDVHWNW